MGTFASYLSIYGGMNEMLKIPYSMIRPIYEKTSFHRAVIEEIPEQELKPAYIHCRKITRYYAKTFYMATRFLPKEKQRAIFAVYGLCRYIDNVVDDAIDLIDYEEVDCSEVENKLDSFKYSLIRVYNQGVSSNPILTAFLDTIRKYHIPIDLPLLMIDGVKQDINKKRYRSFQELYDYSYKVASVVGLMTSRIFGYDDPDALEYAVDLGIAMQLTNILRDVGEDLERNRIYLPADELEQFGLTEQDLFDHVLDERFTEFMKFQVQRARTFYEKADQGILKLDKDSRLPVYLARYNYSRILDKIEENNYQVYKQRAYLNKLEKFSVIPRILLKMNRAS